MLYDYYSGAWIPASAGTTSNMNNSNQKLVSIGLPVYNGMPLLQKAVDSALGQTYRNIELIITDNASTDGTQALCEEYVKKDKRVRYVRHAKNLGAYDNYNSSLHTAKGEYFMWGSHDDYWDLRFVEKCITALESDTEAAMVMSDFAFTDGDGKVIQKNDPKKFFPRETGTYARLKHFILMYWGDGKATLIYGIWRKKAIEHDAYRELPDGDINFVYRGFSRGRFLFVDEVLFYKGVLPDRRSREYEPLTASRGISALVTRIKLVRTHLMNAKFSLSIPGLGFGEALSLFYWNCFVAARMFWKRKL